ncbi:MAG: hypothetical protein ABI705_04270 [Aestuariivirga sp.]
MPARGLMMGNRGGKFHRDDKTLGKRRWASQHWICCDMHYKNMKHEAMGQGYTSLFFLDEVTALAAGHRPCFFCRRADAKAFIGGRKVPEFDRELHAQRLARHEAKVKDLPDGAMIEQDGLAYAVKGQHLLQWSDSGYKLAISRTSLMKARLLTPPLITAILAKGYQPRWHPSAIAVNLD